jgi:IS4 transposase
LRRVKYKDPETGKTLVFLTNNFELQAITIAQLYKQRWQVELFFKWIKQNLHVEVFFGQSENAVKTQIWIAICAYLLIAIFKKRFKLESQLSEILHFLSGILFEQIPIQQVFPELNYINQNNPPSKQLSLLDS